MFMRCEILHRINGKLVKLSGDVYWPNCGGFESPQHASKELRRRFAHRKPRPYLNGIETDGDVCTIHRTTFVDNAQPDSDKAGSEALRQ